LEQKINEICYCDVILSHKLLLAVRQFSGEFTLQQESSPAITDRNNWERTVHKSCKQFRVASATSCAKYVNKI